MISKEKINILIVDDDKEVLDLLKVHLQSKGHHVQTAMNYKSALSLALLERFDLALVDCVLKKDSGLELINKLREYLGESLHIILFSGLFSRNSVSGYLTKSVDDFMRKPISFNDLHSKINAIQQNVTFGKNYNPLLKCFNEQNSIKDSLKEIVSVTESNHVEFLMMLSTLLSSQEKAMIRFSNGSGQVYKFFINQGEIKDCNKANEIQSLFEHLKSQDLINDQDVKHLKGPAINGVIKGLIDSCLVSPNLLEEFKHAVLDEAFNEIFSHTSISFKVVMFDEQSSLDLLSFNQNDFGDYIFNNFNKTIENSIFKIFSEEVLNCSILFKENNTYCNKKLESLIQELKSGIKLKVPFQKDPLSTIYVFSILCKGQAFLISNESQFNHYPLYQRYEKLLAFFKNDEPKEIFQILGNLPKHEMNNHDSIRKVYRYFMKFNHADNFNNKNISKDLIKIINAVIVSIKNNYDLIVDTESNRNMEKSKQKLIMKKALKIEQAFNACLSFLETRQFSEAFTIFKGVKPEDIDDNLDWQLLYLWLSHEKPQFKNEKLYIKYFQNITKNNDQLKRNPVYYYFLGLHYESSNPDRSVNYLKLAQVIEPSAQYVHVALKRAHIQELQKKKDSNFFTKLKKHFNIKKAG